MVSSPAELVELMLEMLVVRRMMCVGISEVVVGDGLQRESCSGN